MLSQEQQRIVTEMTTGTRIDDDGRSRLWFVGGGRHFNTFPRLILLEFFSGVW